MCFSISCGLDNIISVFRARFPNCRTAHLREIRANPPCCMDCNVLAVSVLTSKHARWMVLSIPPHKEQLTDNQNPEKKHVFATHSQRYQQVSFLSILVRHLSRFHFTIWILQSRNLVIGRRVLSQIRSRPFVVAGSIKISS